MSSVRSMTARLLDGLGSVFVSSQVRSMISCGDRAAVSVSCPARSLCYGGTVAPVQEGKKGTSPGRENRGKDPSARGPELWDQPPLVAQLSLTQVLLPHSPQGSCPHASAQSRPGCLTGKCQSFWHVQGRQGKLKELSCPQALAGAAQDPHPGISSVAQHHPLWRTGVAGNKAAF